MAGIRYPNRISNRKLYEKCVEEPIQLTILDARWRLLGHVLRLGPETPAFKETTFFFHQQHPKFRGRPKTTFPITIHNDIQRLKTRKPNKTSTTHQHLTQLKSTSDFQKLQAIAADRMKWKQLTQDMKKAAQAELPIQDNSATGL